MSQIPPVPATVLQSRRMTTRPSSTGQSPLSTVHTADQEALPANKRQLVNPTTNAHSSSMASSSRQQSAPISSARLVLTGVLVDDMALFLLSYGKIIDHPAFIAVNLSIDQCWETVNDTFRIYNAPKMDAVMKMVKATGYEFGKVAFQSTSDLPDYGDVTKLVPHLTRWFGKEEQDAEKGYQDAFYEFGEHSDERDIYMMSLEFFRNAKLAIIEESKEEAGSGVQVLEETRICTRTHFSQPLTEFSMKANGIYYKLCDNCRKDFAKNREKTRQAKK